MVQVSRPGFELARLLHQAAPVGACLVLALSSSADAQGSTSTPSPDDGDAVVIKYDHAGTNKSTAYFRMVRVGQPITITIKNTCKNYFKIGITAVEGETPASTSSSPPACDEGEITETVVHQERYGSYVVELSREDSASQPVFPAGKEVKSPVPLKDVVLTIAVQPRKWDYEVAGGFSFSRLTDPRYGLQSREVTEGGATVMRSFVVEDDDARDSVRLGAAAFIHVFHTEWPHLGPSFGLGVSEASTASYFAGLTYRFGEASAITAGYNWGSVDRLPAGTDVSKPVDANFLSGLGERVDGAFFVAFSYKFLGDRSLLEKPFKKVESKTDSAPKPDQPKPPGKPAGLKVDDKSCILSWDEATGADTYTIEICEAPPCADTPSWTMPSGAEGLKELKYQLKNPKKDSKVRVTAVNKAGKEPSDPYTVPACQAPS